MAEAVISQVTEQPSTTSTIVQEEVKVIFIISLIPCFIKLYHELILQPDQDLPTLRLRLRKPKQCKKVQWSNTTVDNENMNKKKSKCCCIYEKPKKFGESSSDEDNDDECDHCHGHVERKKNKHLEDTSCPCDPTTENNDNPNCNLD